MTLGVPNMEVRESLKSLWWKQLMKIEEEDFTALVDVAKRQLAEGDVRMLIGKTLFSLYAALPPTWRVKSEADAKRHFQLFMKMLGASVQAEESSAFCYADAIINAKNRISRCCVSLGAPVAHCYAMRALEEAGEEVFRAIACT